MTDPLHILQDIEVDRFYRNERKVWIWPRFNRYRVADPKLVKFGLNRYPHHIIGATVVVGHHSYGVLWARLGRRR